MAVQETLLEENSVAAYYDQQDKWLYLSWYGQQTLESRMHAFDQLANFLRTSPCTKLLNDNTFNTTIWTDCALWLTTDWLPRAQENGLRSIAWVYANDFRVRQSASEMINRMAKKITIIPFDDVENAKSWLHSV